MSKQQPPPVVPSDWAGWVWPVPITNGRAPHITDHYQDVADSDHRKHEGVDIMFPKRAGDPLGEVKHSASKGSIAPEGTIIISAGPGKVWSAGVDSYGHWVKVDHGKLASNGSGVTTRYAHLERFAREWKKGDVLRAGDLLGLMGFAPLKDSEQLRHLHFELAFPRPDTQPRDWDVDPAPYMRHWRKVKAPENLS